ncbi:hypothetical protein L1887_18364 [Cichorium endivia]|nr:hypothetical protein L1887_18364 [Cichorium endivia]
MLWKERYIYRSTFPKTLHTPQINGGHTPRLPASPATAVTFVASSPSLFTAVSPVKQGFSSISGHRIISASSLKKIPNGRIPPT